MKSIFGKEKFLYCKYCGLELEKGECHCSDFLLSKNVKKVYDSIIKCDTCDKEIDADANFCPYCGIPIHVDGNNKKLQKELRGEFAEDVLVKLGIKSDLTLKQKIDKNIPKPIQIIILVLIVVLLFLLGMKFISPIIDRYKKKEEEEETIATKSEIEETIEEMIEETIQPLLEGKNDRWIRQDGFFYCFNEEGDPVVDEWITETEEDGTEKHYYFDIDGKLVVNSWIDGEYYVGEDGAMLVDTDTPDGARVDKDGKVIIRTENDKVITEKETQVYYESPNSTEIVASNQKSANSGVMKGVNPDKEYEIRMIDIKMIRESVEKNNQKCNITYYYPIVAAIKEKEQNNVNNIIVETFEGRFKEFLKSKMSSWPGELPKSITLNTVDQRQLTSTRYMFIVSGKIIPRKGLSEKVKYRFTYDRKSKTIAIKDISNE